MLWQLELGRENLTWFMCDCFSSENSFLHNIFEWTASGGPFGRYEALISIQAGKSYSNKFLSADSITRVHSAISCNPVWRKTLQIQLVECYCSPKAACICNKSANTLQMWQVSSLRDYAKLQTHPSLPTTAAHLNFITVIPSESCDIDIHIWFDYTWKQIFVSDLRVGCAGGMNWVNGKNLDYVIRKSS